MTQSQNTASKVQSLLNDSSNNNQSQPMTQALRPSIRPATPARKETRAVLRRAVISRGVDLSDGDSFEDLHEACEIARLRETIGAGRSIVGDWGSK